ncbi:DMT family transporter [Pseudomonas sp. Fl4BN1]|uniref:DMT family transporter n=1 Tax=Pseudomonas sp. Fl4BN1 TaxID=2697651 RepID=UPI001378F708|nr:DMT family transporter [Pseudomonas sp. Fl4BN1]NBF07279.1 EamA family transporter [Pseudomonas sp. Fl4BN1]
MNNHTTSLALGVAFAVFATLSWSVNFIAPYITGNYSLYDLMALRFLMAGAIGACLLWVNRTHLRGISRGLRCLGLGLGVIGYLGYSACIAGGVLLAGPVLTPALIGLVPVLMALLGNSRSRTLPWGRLALPLGFLLAGLGLIHLGSLGQATVEGSSLGVGLLFSLGAIAVWLIFSLLNQRAMESLSVRALGAWTGLMMSGGALAMLLLLPLGLHLELFRLPTLGFSWAQAGSLYLWALMIALCSSVAGAWAWNLATRHLPMVLSGQLVALESLFATLLGLLFHGRWPTLFEGLGLMAVLTGTVLAVRVIMLRGEPGIGTLRTGAGEHASVREP